MIIFLLIIYQSNTIFQNFSFLSQLTERLDADFRRHLLVVGVDALAPVVAAVLLPQALDEEHHGSVAGLLLSVDPEMYFRSLDYSCLGNEG